ncbi:methyl-accepting chemotaxis protein [Metabacillus lacus]|nr:HAMP domain-containing methyl-accepting chemotaxis protein [Metabacillus lacus]
MNSLKGKILTGFAIILTILITISSYNYFAMNSLSNQVEEITDNDMVFLEDINSISFSVANRAKIARDYILFNREEFKVQFLEETEKAIQTEENLFKAINEGVISGGLAASIKEADEKTIRWRKLVTDQIIPLYDSGDQEGAVQLMAEKCLPYSQEAIDAWVKVVDIQNEITKTQAENAVSTASQAKIFTAVGLIAAVVISIAVALYIANKISRAISLVVQRLEIIANGDLRGELLETKSEDEVGRLIKASNSMVQNLKALLSRVAETSNQLAVSSQQFTASAQQSSSSAMQVTTSVQEIAKGAEYSAVSAMESVSAMDSMSKEVQRIAHSSSDVSQESQSSNQQAVEGRALIQKAVTQMHSIEVSVGTTADLISELGVRSNEIGQIVEVITGIASQTNLLALNAAIEAARAGEQGLGFAVVADEVRKLAEQSKNSADQIAQLINEIQQDTHAAIASMDSGTKEVNIGTNVINEAGQAFGKIQESIKLVSEKIDEVSTSTEQMAASAQQVNATIVSLADIAHNTSENSQNVAAASEEQLATMQQVSASVNALSSLSDELQNELSKFKF